MPVRKVTSHLARAAPGARAAASAPSCRVRH